MALTPSAVGRLAESGQRSSSRKEPARQLDSLIGPIDGAGAEIVDRKTALSQALVTALDLPQDLPGGGMIIGLLKPLERPDQMRKLAAAGHDCPGL